jgi:hypothetical protein
MKYRFSIGHSLTLGRFQIKLPALGERLYLSLSLFAYWTPFNPPADSAIRPVGWSDRRQELGTFVVSRGACYRCERERYAGGAKKNKETDPAATPDTLPPAGPLRCILLGRALMRLGGDRCCIPGDRSGWRTL